MTHSQVSNIYCFVFTPLALLASVFLVNIALFSLTSVAHAQGNDSESSWLSASTGSNKNLHTLYQSVLKEVVKRASAQGMLHSDKSRFSWNTTNAQPSKSGSPSNPFENETSGIGQKEGSGATGELNGNWGGFFSNYTPDTTPDTNGSDGRITDRIMEAFGLKQERSTENTDELLDAIRGIHFASERNALYNRSGQKSWQKLWLGQEHFCPNGRNCSSELDERVSAVHLRYKWGQINPAEGAYNFEHIGAALDKLHAAGKRATIVIMGGKYTPQWVIDKGAKTIPIELRTRDREIAEGSAQKLLPRPWGGVYSRAYRDVHQELADYLHEKPSRYDTLALVKVGGVVVHSGEVRLMPTKPFMSKRQRQDEEFVADFRADLCQAWADSNYSEDKVRRANLKLAGWIDRAFPDKLIGMATVAGSNRFPTIIDGECRDDERNNTVRKLSVDLAKEYGKRFVANTTTMYNDSTADIPLLKAAERQGGNAAFQLNAQEVGCRKEDNPCSNRALRTALDAGFDAGAVFIEVHDGNFTIQEGILRQYNRKYGG